MAVREYVGARYVPLFAEPAQWSDARTYEPLTIVMNEGNSYTSRQYVPLGIPLTDENYWALTGNYNAQVEAYRKEVAAISENLKSVKQNYHKVYANVQSMSADKSMVSGMVVSTLGFYAPGDGGNAAYVVSSTGADDGLTIIACQNGLHAHLTVLATECSVKAFGAVCDGTTDDSTAVQKAFDWPVVDLVFPGDCKFSGITVNSNKKVVFNGKIVPTYKDQYNNTFKNVFSVQNCSLDLHGCEFECAPTTIDVIRNASYPSIESFSIVENGELNFYNCEFSNISMGRTAPYAGNFVVERLGIISTAYGSSNVLFDKCSFSNIMNFEWNTMYSMDNSGNVDAGYQGTMTVSGCTIFSTLGEKRGYSTFNCVGNHKAKFIGNTVNGFEYSGSFLNFQCNDITIEGNYMANILCRDVFDCSSEDITFSIMSDMVVCKDNIIVDSTVNRSLLPFCAKNVIIEGNNVCAPCLANGWNLVNVSMGDIAEVTYIDVVGNTVDLKGATSGKGDTSYSLYSSNAHIALTVNGNGATPQNTYSATVANNTVLTLGSKRYVNDTNIEPIKLETFWGEYLKYLDYHGNHIEANGRGLLSMNRSSLIDFRNSQGAMMSINGNYYYQQTHYGSSAIIQGDGNEIAGSIICNNIVQNNGTYAVHAGVSPVPIENNNFNSAVS